MAGGVAYCWGGNDKGMLGNGNNTDQPSPAFVTGGHGFQVLRAGAFHTCGLTADGTAYCWGENFDWTIGDGTQTNQNVPTLVDTSVKFGRPSGD
jgi:alpha-tubulin suppressor-like RCC1 family protein